MDQQTIENQNAQKANKYINDIMNDSESDFNNFLVLKQ